MVVLKVYIVDRKTKWHEIYQTHSIRFMLVDNLYIETFPPDWCTMDNINWSVFFILYFFYVYNSYKTKYIFCSHSNWL